MKKMPLELCRGVICKKCASQRISYLCGAGLAAGCAVVVAQRLCHHGHQRVLGRQGQVQAAAPGLVQVQRHLGKALRAQLRRVALDSIAFICRDYNIYYALITHTRLFVVQMVCHLMGQSETASTMLSFADDGQAKNCKT